MNSFSLKTGITWLILLTLFVSLADSVNASNVDIQSSSPNIWFNDTDVNANGEWILGGTEQAFSIWNVQNEEFPLIVSPSSTTGIGLLDWGMGISGSNAHNIVQIYEDAPWSFDIFANGDIGFAEGAMYFDRTNRHLGVGTFTPIDDIHIASSQPGIIFDDTSSNSADWYAGNSGNDFSFYLVSNETGGPTGEVMTLDAQTGNVGINQPNPSRQLHLTGPNALFRMDRSKDTAAFMIVRTTPDGQPLKNFVVGTNASGPNVGEFIINDLGQATYGSGKRRMTITNSGDVVFTGSVQAADFVTPSSRRLKENIEPIENSLMLTMQLEGVQYDYRESGKHALGFIAEDVVDVLPEAVKHDEESGQTIGINYVTVVPVLVEAIKEQQKQIEVQNSEIVALRKVVNELQAMNQRLAKVEKLVSENQLDKVLVRH